MSGAEKKITTNPSAVFSEMSITTVPKDLQKETSRSKPVKIIPVRQTLTSKLRMTKAASVISSDASDKTDTGQPFRAGKPSVRRTNFHKDIMRGKQLGCIGTFSGVMPIGKKARVSFQRKNKEMGHFKENILPHGRRSQKIIGSEDEYGVITSVLSRKCDVDKCLSKSFYKKNVLSSFENKSKFARHPNKSNQLQPWDKTSFLCSHGRNFFQYARNTPSTTKILNNNKRRAFNATQAVSKSSIKGFHTQITKSDILPCNSAAEDNIEIEELTKVKRKGEESISVRILEDQLCQIQMFQDRSKEQLVFDSHLYDSTSEAPKTLISLDSIKRVEEWLKSRKSSTRHNDPHLRGSAEQNVFNSKTDDATSNSRKIVTSASLDSIHSFSHCRNKGSNFYDESPRLVQAAAVTVKENIDLLDKPPIDYSQNTLTHSSNLNDERNECLAVTKSRPPVKDLTKYWEYLTHLQKARRDFSSEVNRYGQAILSGNNVQIVEKNLGELEERFRYLSTSLEDKGNYP